MACIVDTNKPCTSAGVEDDADATDRSGSVESAFSNFHDPGRSESLVNDGSSHGYAAVCDAPARVPDAATTHQTVHESKPLFQRGWTLLDCCVFIWVTFSHLLLTFWPLCGLAIMAAPARPDATMQHQQQSPAKRAGSPFSRVLAYITVFALGTLLLPPCRHSQRVVDVLDACFFHHWKRHISFKVVHEAGVSRERQYVAACFPHGVFPLAAQMHATVWPALHTHPLSVLAASVLFYCPLWRHYMSVGGCVPASFKVLRRELAAGNSALVHAGGIAEMFVCEREREVVVLRARRGFVRAALEAGVPLLPVYYFGNSQLLSFGPRCMRNLSRRLKMSIGFVHGVLGLPVLRRLPVTAVVGTPIDVGPATPPGTPAFDARVEELHAQFVDALAALYERHRGTYSDGRRSWEGRPLIIT